jgi:hypothetical protein
MMPNVSGEILAILIWGFAATAAMSVVMFTSQWLGYSRLSLPFLLGSLFTGERSPANALGIVLYLLGGWLFAILYYFIFESIGRAGWEIGALVGATQGLLMVAMILPLLPYVHPRMATEYEGPVRGRRLQPPGFLALNYGYRTPLTTIAAHTLYGLILGAGLVIR